jgi:multidrug resistance efflux pump
MRCSIVLLVAQFMIVGTAAISFAAPQSESSPAGTVAQSISHAGDGYVDLAPCFTNLIADVSVPAQESGPLISVDVQEGQAIDSGQQLAAIDDRVAQLRLETASTKRDAATEKANSDIDIRAAQNALEIAEREQKTDYGLYQKGSLPRQEYDRTALQARQAALQLEQAQRDKEAAFKEAQVEELNVRAANDSIRRHSIVSPVAGNVMELYKQAGEWVNAGDNVMRVARLDQLYVEGILDTAQYNPHDVAGRPVTVVARLAQGDQAEFTGRIVFVSQEKLSRGVAVRAVVDNREVNGHWLLLAMEEVTMRIHLDRESIAVQPKQRTIATGE